MAIDPPAAPPWVYQQPAAIVEQQIAAMSDRADTALQVTYGTIEALGKVNIGGDQTAPPGINFPNVPGSEIDRPDKPSVRNFGDVDDFVAPSFQNPSDLLVQIDQILAGVQDPGAYVPPIAQLAIPSPPAPIDTSGAPTRPSLDAVVIPDEPVYQNPSMGGLLDITIPPPPTLDFPMYEDVSAVFQGTPVQTVLNWTEPTYQPAVLNELTATIQAMLAGDFIMPAIVEAMIFDRDRERQDTTSLKATQEAFDTWAARGFAMPPGMLVEQVNAVQQQNQLEANARARDVLQKSADWEIENLRKAVGDGIQLESVLISQFNNMAQRTFEAARARLDADVQMFGQYVALYNADQQSRQVAVAVFNARLQAVVTRLEAWKTQLQGEQIKGQLNETTARIYATQVEALRTIVEQFKARLDGARIKSEINKVRLDGYRVDVEAYAARLQADKTRFEAYDSQMRGVESQARVIEASARAFAATAEAQTSVANVKISAIRGKLDALGYSTQRFVAEAGAERDRISAQAQSIASRAQAFQADCTRYGAELQANTEETRLEITVAESRLRNLLAYYETRVREYDQAMSRLIERSRVVVQALSSAGQMASQLAGGAMSAMHVQANISGSGNASTTWSNSYSRNDNYNFEGD